MTNKTIKVGNTVTIKDYNAFTNRIDDCQVKIIEIAKSIRGGITVVYKMRRRKAKRLPYDAFKKRIV